MEKQLSIESLQADNARRGRHIADLRNHLRDRAIIAHAAARKLSLIAGDLPVHLGPFDNCPAPECVEVRTLLERTDDGKL